MYRRHCTEPLTSLSSLIGDEAHAPVWELAPNSSLGPFQYLDVSVSISFRSGACEPLSPVLL